MYQRSKLKLKWKWAKTMSIRVVCWEDLEVCFLKRPAVRQTLNRSRSLLLARVSQYRVAKGAFLLASQSLKEKERSANRKNALLTILICFPTSLTLSLSL